MKHLDVIACEWVTMSRLSPLSSLKRKSVRKTQNQIVFLRICFGVWNGDSISKLDKAGVKQQITRLKRNVVSNF